VDERLPFVPEGTGEHCFVRLEKVGLTTRDVQLDLARHHRLTPLDVGYAGMKDKHAVARQWFSLRGVEEPSAPADQAMKILETSRHPKKLRRGELGGNRFAVRLRGVAAEDRGTAEAGLRALANRGAPNYFGPQRFGENNLEAAREWLAGRRRAERPDGRRRGRRRSGGARFREGLHISVLRSFLFNEVLAERVRAGTWREPIPGDVLENDRPTGPLWGRGRSPAEEAAAEVEARVLSCHEEIRHGLEHAGVSQNRRPLVLEADGLEWRIVDAPDGSLTVEVEFGLPAGGYATSLLGEVFELVPAVAGAAAA
jgi:tRNA pseudouridine13 synthase